MPSPVTLVTGGAGFLGINLCRHLLGIGRRVRSIDVADFDYPERNAVEVIDGDIRDAAAVERSMQDVETAVHCAAALPLAPAEDIRSTDVDGTRLLLESSLTHRVARFIFISSTAVYGIPDHHPLLETDRTQGVGPYGESKIAAEALCSEFRARGLCVSVLRPKTFVGPERLGVFELLYEWAREGRNFPLIGPGNNRYQLLDVADLCQAIELCMTREPGAVSDTFNVGAKEFGTMRENVQAVLDRAGHGGHAIGLPRAPAVLALRALNALHLSPMYRWIYETAAEDSFVSIERIERKLGYRPRYSNRDALVRNYDWYVAHRDEIRPVTGTTHRVRWKRGVLDLARHFF
ncbi:MAG: NAD(P)-dependent oxidoreductase [Steroidobacteraceae bacterium]